MVDDYKITVLSDMIPGRRTIGEWCFSALVEVRSAGAQSNILVVNENQCPGSNEKTNMAGTNIQPTDGKIEEVFLPEESAVIINTPTGMAVITDCFHAGITNTNQMKINGVETIPGAHCTGFERFFFIRNFLGLDDAANTFSSVGTILSQASVSVSV